MENRISFFKAIKNKATLIIFSIIFFTLIPFAIVYLFVKPVNDTYNVSFSYEEQIENYESLIAYDSLVTVKNDIIEYRQEIIDAGNKAPYSDFSYVNIKKMTKNKNISISYNEEEYTISISQKYFNSLAQARRFIKGLAENKLIIDDLNVSYNDPICYALSIDNYMVLGFSFLGAFALVLILFIIIYKIDSKFFIENVKYDNERIYRFPLSINYWKKASKECNSTRKMVLLAVLFALQLCTKFVSIPSGFSSLGLGLGYLVFSVISLIFGPIVGIFIGMGSDILGYFLKPSGVFFFGYTLSAMISGFTYGLCLYKTKITFTKCLLSRIVINLFVNSVLGTLWWWLINDKTIDFNTYMLVTELPKNLVYLIPQSLLMYYFIKILSPVLKTSNYVEKDICDKITFI